MFNRSLTVAALVLMLGGCTDSMIELGGMPSTNLNEGDNAFFKKISLANMAEIDTSRVALSLSDNSAVKKFAQHMIDDHSKASQQLSDLAVGKGVILPVELDPKDQSDVDMLSSKTGSDLDHAYAQLQVTDHKQAIAIAQDEADNGIDPDTKAFAIKLLPTLNMHLAMAEELLGK